MRSTTLEATWMALALGALEPGDAAALLRSAGPGAPLRLATLRLLAGLRAGLVAAPAPVPATAGLAPVMESRPGRPRRPEWVAVGERARLRIEPPEAAEGLRPMVFRQAADGITRMLPVAGAPWPTLDRFLEEDGARVIDIQVAGPTGTHVIVIGLLAASVVEDAWPEGSPLDERVLTAVLAGELPGAVVELQVV